MNKDDMDKAIPLQLGKKKKAREPTAAVPPATEEKSKEPKGVHALSGEELAVTVAAFVLNSETRSVDLDLGFENQNTKDVRDEILKAIREEGRKMD